MVCHYVVFPTKQLDIFSIDITNDFCKNVDRIIDLTTTQQKNRFLLPGRLKSNMFEKMLKYEMITVICLTRLPYQIGDSVC